MSLKSLQTDVYIHLLVAQHPRYSAAFWQLFEARERVRSREVRHQCRVLHEGYLLLFLRLR